MEDFIDSHLVEKSVGFQNLIKRNKLKTLAACEVKKKQNIKGTSFVSMFFFLLNIMSLSFPL